jgi:hypothetical protein
MLADDLGMRLLRAHGHRSLGTLFGITGQREQARAALSTAVERYQSMGMTFWLPQTEATLAQMTERRAVGRPADLTVRHFAQYRIMEGFTPHNVAKSLPLNVKSYRRRRPHDADHRCPYDVPCGAALAGVSGWHV